MTRFRLKSLIDYFAVALLVQSPSYKAGREDNGLSPWREPQRRSWATGPQPEGPGLVVSITSFRSLDRPKGMWSQARLVLETTSRRRIREIINQRLPVFDHLNHFFCRTGCPNAATKSPGAILDDATGVGPQGGGQDARINSMDGRERPSEIDTVIPLGQKMLQPTKSTRLLPTAQHSG